MDDSPVNSSQRIRRKLAQEGGYSQAEIINTLGIRRSRLTGWFKDGRIPRADHALGNRRLAVCADWPMTPQRFDFEPPDILADMVS